MFSQLSDDNSDISCEYEVILVFVDGVDVCGLRYVVSVRVEYDFDGDYCYLYYYCGSYELLAGENGSYFVDVLDCVVLDDSD